MLKLTQKVCSGAAEDASLQINGIFPQNVSSQGITLTPQTTGGNNGTPETITGHIDTIVLLYEPCPCIPLGTPSAF